MSTDSTDPNIPSDGAVIPPAPPESSIPDAVIPPPPPESSVPDAVIPPPPPEAMLPVTRRSRSPILTGDQPAPVAEDWAQPSVAPEVPTSGGYRGLSFVIFIFLFLLLAAAVAAGIYLAVATPFALAEDVSSAAIPAFLRSV